MSDVSETPEQASERASANGCEVVFGGDKILLLDFDSQAKVEQFEADSRRRIQRFYRIKKEEWWSSKSGLPHCHAAIYIDHKLPVAERIGIAIAAGSDPVRGMLALYRIHLGNQDVDRLFRPKGARIFDYPPYHQNENEENVLHTIGRGFNFV